MREFNRNLRNYELVLIGGMIGVLFSARAYPVLDWNLIVGFSFALFVGPILFHVWFINRGRVPSRVDLARGVFKWIAIAMVGFASLLFVNGALDRFPPVQVSSQVIAKSAHTGRGGPDYSFTVSPSWRGKQDEHLRVSRATFSIAQVGDPIILDVHRGAIGIPWFSNVRAASAANNTGQN